MNNTFRKNISIATFSSVLGFVISLVLTPVMTRWYLPVDYGVFALVNNLASFFASFFLLSLPNALPVISTTYSRVRLLLSLMTLSFCAFFVSGVGVVLYLISVFSKSEGFSGEDFSIALIPFLILIISFHRIARSWASAEALFTEIAVARVVHPIFAKPTAILASMTVGSNSIYMVFFECFAYVVQIAVMTQGRIKNIKRIVPRVKSKTIYSVLGSIKKYKEYALFLNFVNLLALGFVALQTVILSVAYSTTEVGLFSLAMSMSTLPIQLMSMAIAPVIYHKLIVVARDEPRNLQIILCKLLFSSLMLGLIPYSIIYFYGSDLFSIAFGGEWGRSGSIASILAFPIFLQFVYIPVSSIFRVTYTIKLQFKIDVFFISLAVIVFYISVRSLPFIESLKLFAFIYSIHQIVLILLCFYVSKYPGRQLLKANSLE